MNDQMPVSSYVTSFSYDQEPLPSLAPITATSGEFANFNKVWVMGGECYLLPDEHYQQFLQKCLENPRGLAINEKLVRCHQSRNLVTQP
ncbi:hypothetical protein [Pseudomonas putida]|jgi:hypothetical protein|uniref:Uncharacterized protein n=1 Tax=Pseudomonas putida TaxID=303 RepID=A0A9X8EL50_PSEPU|nr:hypothetical protein [Pseudomonas putida]ROQ53652.1 hypothetical protein EDF85_1416 [Pseudomonas putida]